MDTQSGSAPFRRMVVKLGTSTLTAGTSRLHLPRLVDLVRQMAQLHQAGREVVLVTSGAIAAGRERLAFRQLPPAIPLKQMLAAVGQPRLMALYEQLFDLYEVVVAQVLLTRSDLSDRRRYLNARNTLEALLAERVLPIINENDTVATEEIRVGDNDTLSALVSSLVEADLLVLLTDQPGLFNADPRHYPAAQLIEEIDTPHIPETLWRAASSTAGELGTGGMLTKLQAADLGRRAGATVVIAGGGEPEVLLRLALGEHLGTRFLPCGTPLEGRKRFILAGRRPSGAVIVDEGAVQAMRRGSSLLPVGILRVRGSFERGDVVQVIAPEGGEVARGLINYASSDLERICGQRSEAIERILGFFYGEEAIHRNNLVLL